MDHPDPAHLFRQAAEEAARYRSTFPARPHKPADSYLESLARFSAELPSQGAPGDQVLAQLIEQADPGLNAMPGPRFFGWVMGASHPVAVAADWMTAVWGQNAGNHVASPAAAAAETVAARWLLELLGLPQEASVGFVTGATMANFVGLAAARSEVLRRVGWDVEANGLFGAPPITVLIGDDAHTTIYAGLQYLGLGHDRVRRIRTDEAGRMVPEAFAEAAREASGPVIAILQAGQINTGAFDDFDAIIPLAREAGAWVHVDGAFGLWARATPRRKHLAEGIELADSWATDGHKWLQVPFDSGYVFVRDSDAHRRAMTIAASYLPAAGETERDPSHLVPELSRRARGFPTWAIIRHLGRNGISEMVERHCAVARDMAERLAAEDGVHVLNTVELNQVIVRFGSAEPGAEADRQTVETIRRIQHDGVLFAGGADWRGRKVMRLSVTSWGTTLEEGQKAVDGILQAFDAVRMS